MDTLESESPIYSNSRGIFLGYSIFSENEIKDSNQTSPSFFSPIHKVLVKLLNIRSIIFVLHNDIVYDT